MFSPLLLLILYGRLTHSVFVFADLLIQRIESWLQPPNPRELVCDTSVEWGLDVWVEILATPLLELIPRHEGDGYLAGDVRHDVSERASPFRVEVVSRCFLLVASRNPEDLVGPVSFRGQGGIRARSDSAWPHLSSARGEKGKRKKVRERRGAVESRDIWRRSGAYYLPSRHKLQYFHKILPLQVNFFDMDLEDVEKVLPWLFTTG